MNAPRVGAGFHGTLAGYPIIVAVENEAGTLCWRGQLRIEHKTLHELMRVGDSEPLDPVFSGVLEEIIGPRSETLEVAYAHELFEFSLSLNTLTFRALRRRSNLAFTLKLGGFHPPNPLLSSNVSPLWSALGRVREALGPWELFLAYRKGNFSINEISNGIVTTAEPPIVANATWLLVGKYSFGDSTAGRAIKQLFGGSGDLEIIAGYRNGQFSICLTIPAVQTKYVKIAGLYILMNLGSGVPQFQFQGDFIFQLDDENELTITATSSFTASSFLLSAEVNFKQSFPLPLLDAVSFDNAAVLIGSVAAGLTLGFFATLRIRELFLFGALILTVEGNVVVPTLVSGAIGSLSIRELYENFTGGNLDGLDAFDVVKLEGLTFSFQQPFDVSLFQKRDTDAIATFFNEQVHNDALVLQASEIQIRQHDGGYSLVDRQRMRHYFIDALGVISLRAQFYYAAPLGSIQFGNFRVSAGIFLAGTIQVFDVSIELLFSIREREGLLAFARIAPIEIWDPTKKHRILLISEVSKKEEKTSNPIELELPADDLLRALVPLKETGLVFYLSASKREVTFYFDGRVTLLDIFEAKASVIYAAKQVSIHVETDVFGVQAMVFVDASYANFLSAKLRVRISVDTNKLRDRLTAVTNNIDGAVLALKATMENARESLDAAQERVNALHDEIADLNNRIKKCRSAIRRASEFKRPIVAIAKGLEIAAYEVAKAGVSTAIEVATANLLLARKAVTVLGNTGKDVLEFVNKTIQATSALFFIRHVELKADISLGPQTFAVDIAFVALGKLYTFKKSVEGDVLRKGLAAFLEKMLPEWMNDDPEKLKKGKLPGRAVAFAVEAAGETEPIPKIERASATIDKASGLFRLMFERYRENFGEDLSDFDALQTSFLAALEVADHALTTAKKAMPETNSKSIIAAMEEKLGEIPGAHRKMLDALDEVANVDKLQEHIDAASSALANARKTVALPRAPTPARDVEVRAFATTAEPMSEVEFLKDLQAEVRQTFANQPDDGYIDLSKESKLDDRFRAAMTALGSAPEPKPEARAISFGTGRPYKERL